MCESSYWIKFYQNKQDFAQILLDQFCFYFVGPLFFFRWKLDFLKITLPNSIHMTFINLNNMHDPHKIFSNIIWEHHGYNHIYLIILQYNAKINISQSLRAPRFLL